MIPKQIWQTSPFEYEELPYYLKVMAETWQELNPDYKYNYVSDLNCQKMILTDYGQEYLDLYKSIDIGFVRADFWRYLILKKHGGFYADIDTYCLKSLSDWITIDAEMVVAKETFGDLGTVILQWFFGTTPDNQYISNIVKIMLDKVNDKSLGNQITTTHTSPWVFTEGIESIKKIDGLIFYNDSFTNEQGEENIRHISANNKFTDYHINNKPMESTYWNIGNNANIKIYNNSYNSSSVKDL